MPAQKSPGPPRGRKGPFSEHRYIVNRANPSLVQTSHGEPFTEGLFMTNTSMVNSTQKVKLLSQFLIKRRRRGDIDWLQLHEVIFSADKVLPQQ